MVLNSWVEEIWFWKSGNRSNLEKLLSRKLLFDTVSGGV
jgi:hypothetical protein